jgi:hypothetical protein
MKKLGALYRKYRRHVIVYFFPKKLDLGKNSGELLEMLLQTTSSMLVRWHTLNLQWLGLAGMDVQAGQACRVARNQT